MSMMGGGAARRQEKMQREQFALQAQQLDEMRAQQREQAKQVREQGEKTAMVEDAARRVRGGRRRGLLALADDIALGGAT